MVARRLEHDRQPTLNEKTRILAKLAVRGYCRMYEAAILLGKGKNWLNPWNPRGIARTKGRIRSMCGNGLHRADAEPIIIVLEDRANEKYTDEWLKMTPQECRALVSPYRSFVKLSEDSIYEENPGEREDEL